MTLKLIGAFCVLYIVAGVLYVVLIEVMLMSCVFRKPRKDPDMYLFVGWPIHLLTDFILVVLYILRVWYRSVLSCNSRVKRFLA